MTASFVNLHVHSDHSRLDGAASLDRYFARAQALGQTHLTLTDHGSMSGHYDAVKLASRYNVKPILGCEVYVAPGSKEHRHPVYWGTPDQKKKDVGGQGSATHMTMIALNVTGLRNLYRMQYYASTEGFYRNPRVDVELMKQYSEGILVTSGCAGSAVSVRLRLGQWEEAVRTALELQEIYGKENFYVEVMDHGIVEDDLVDAELNEQLIKLAEHIGAPLVATNDSHYCEPEDSHTHDAFLCLQTSSKLADEKRLRFNGSGFHLASAEEMLAKFPDHPEAISNTQVIADRVESYDSHFEFKNRMPHLPEIDPDMEGDALAEMCFAELYRRFDGHPRFDEYLARLEFELDIIAKTGFDGYFVVLGDITTWAAKQKIRMSPCRGSAGGSLVCFLMHITGVDPVLHDLPFERFLNLDRVSFPDIDIDFETERRAEVVEYARRRFGFDKVSKISTLGTLTAKAALKDAARVLGHDFAFSNRLTAMYPNPIHGFVPPLSCVFDLKDPRYGDAAGIRSAVNADPATREVYELACKIEGLIRNFGVHAGGLIISSEPLRDVIPTKLVDGDLVTGFDQPAMEPMGLIKYDFLGLENLTIINNSLRYIKQVYGIDLILEELPLDDAETFAMLAQGKSLGVFQLDSPGMQRLLKRMRPSQFRDLAAVLALYRPGPMGVGAHELYADRKTGRVPVEPIHAEFSDALRDVLEPTYGVIPFQETVMKVLQVVADYSPGEADAVRRIMGKKQPEVMAKLEPELRTRVTAKGYSDEAFEALWEILVPFSAYGFNKAHSFGYAMVAYWTAYMKCHYPIPYFSALLSAESDDQEKLSIYLNDAREIGVQILPPDINESDSGFTPTKGGIRFGLYAIKNVGPNVIEVLRRNDYPTLSEFYAKIPDKVNTRALQALIGAGAFDTFGSRAVHYDASTTWLERAKALRKAEENGDITLARPTYRIPDEQTSPESMRAWEDEFLGVILTLPKLKVALSRSLTELEWDWINKMLADSPGTQKVSYVLGSMNFTSGQRVSASAKLVGKLNVLNAITSELG